MGSKIERCAILGAVCGFVSAVLLWNHVSFIWYAVTGCVPTLILGYAISFLALRRPVRDVLPMTIWGRDRATSLGAPDSSIAGEQPAQETT